VVHAINKVEEVSPFYKLKRLKFVLSKGLGPRHWETYHNAL
jgi:hypothetical protein